MNWITLNKLTILTGLRPNIEKQLALIGYTYNLVTLNSEVRDEQEWVSEPMWLEYLSRDQLYLIQFPEIGVKEQHQMSGAQQITHFINTGFRIILATNSVYMINEIKNLLDDSDFTISSELAVKNTTVQVHCKVCNIEFTAKIADLKRGWAQCCSKSHAAIYRTQHQTL